jgi:predicted Zn-dependent protease
MSHLLEGYQWEFNLGEGKEVNAWCMPGGKVVVYTGLLPVAQDDDGWRWSWGMKMAHAVANHGGERMSQGLIAQMGRHCPGGGDPRTAAPDSAALE